MSEEATPQEVESEVVVWGEDGRLLLAGEPAAVDTFLATFQPLRSLDVGALRGAADGVAALAAVQGVATTGGRYVELAKESADKLARYGPQVDRGGAVYGFVRSSSGQFAGNLSLTRPAASARRPGTRPPCTRVTAQQGADRARALLRRMLQQLPLDGDAAERADTAERLLREQSLARSLRLLLLAEQCRLLYRSLKLDQVRRTEPEALGDGINAAQRLLAGTALFGQAGDTHSVLWRELRRYCSTSAAWPAARPSSCWTRRTRGCRASWTGWARSGQSATSCGTPCSAGKSASGSTGAPAPTRSGGRSASRLDAGRARRADHGVGRRAAVGAPRGPSAAVGRTRAGCPLRGAHQRPVRFPRPDRAATLPGRDRRAAGLLGRRGARTRSAGRPFRGGGADGGAGRATPSAETC